jgi:hypothetical protein
MAFLSHSLISHSLNNHICPRSKKRPLLGDVSSLPLFPLPRYNYVFYNSYQNQFTIKVQIMED